MFVVFLILKWANAPLLSWCYAWDWLLDHTFWVHYIVFMHVWLSRKSTQRVSKSLCRGDKSCDTSEAPQRYLPQGCHDVINGDGELTFSTHIQRLFYQLRQLRTIHYSLDNEAAKTLVHAFIVTQLDYCNSVLSGMTKILLDNSGRSWMLLLVWSLN